VRTAETDAGAGWTEPGEEVGLTKTGVVRQVRLCPELVGILRAHIGDRTSGTVVEKLPTYSNFTRAWHRARRDAPWTPYDQRHLYASTAVSRGVPLATVARQLGHSVETLVRVYAHALPKDDERLAALMDGAL